MDIDAGFSYQKIIFNSYNYFHMDGGDNGVVTHFSAPYSQSDDIHRYSTSLL